MAAPRYVVLGLANARSTWFRDVAQWSNASAVLIMAFLGVAMWLGFRQTLGTTQSHVNTQVTKIGTDNGAGGTGVGGSTGSGSGGTGGTPAGG